MAKLATQCAAELAGLADKLKGKVPETEEWTTVRQFLDETTRLLRSRDVMAGVVAFQRVLPYIEKALGHVDRYMKVSDTYQITETITEHFLVAEEAREQIHKYLCQTKLKMIELREEIENFGLELDDLLAAVLKEAKEIDFWMAVKLAFKMNRIAALIETCEDRLQTARSMIDDLDTHVASKNLIANLVSYVCFAGSLLLSATGYIPAGAAALATATATRRSAKGLSEYRRQLSQINQDHVDLQSELKEWHYKFRAEQRNFLLLAGIKYAILLLFTLAICFICLGKAANFLFFGAIFIFLLIKAEQTNSLSYYAVLSLSIMAIIMQWQKYQGLIAFNTGSAIFLTIRFLGFLEII